MRAILLAGVAVAALSGAPALAADMPLKAPAPVAVPFSWAGFYIGVHGGYGWGDYKFADNINAERAQLDPGGGLGGFQIGYNAYLAPNWVLGTEIDFSLADIRDSGATSPGAFAVSTKVDFLGTARTRFGYATDRTLFYATGGMAWAHLKAIEQPVGALQSAPDAYHVGWTVGGGLEYAFDPRWSAKIEYLYADFGRYINAGGSALSIRSGELTLSTVKAGLNYRFGDPAPSASAMPVKARPAAWTWNGSYIGAHAGYAWGDFQALDTASSVANLDPRGAFGGFQAGYNWQFAQAWLFGIETDTSLASIKRNGTAFPVPGGVPAPVPASVKVDELGTIRGRLGYIVDRSLFYGTGGFAWGHLKFLEPTVMRTDEYHAGWTAGAGWEYALDADWSAKIEYLYVDLGRNSDVTSSFPRYTTLTLNTVKAGVNYHGLVLERLFGAR